MRLRGDNSLFGEIFVKESGKMHFMLVCQNAIVCRENENDGRSSVFIANYQAQPIL